MKPPTNSNCLEGLNCPKCGSEGPFKIRAEATFVADNGTEDYEAVEWAEESRCSCLNCNESSTVLGFHMKKD